MTDPRQALESAGTVTLVDWPSADVPRTLVMAGFTVNSVNRLAGTGSSYSVCARREDVPAVEHVTVLDPEDDDGRYGYDGGYLVIQPLAEPPRRTDIVCVYRPAEELPEIARFAAALGASTLWLQRGVRSDEARKIAEEAGLGFVEDTSIADVIRATGIRK
jgi:CoA binding domain